jgi:hypothetical protein
MQENIQGNTGTTRLASSLNLTLKHFFRLKWTKCQAEISLIIHKPIVTNNTASDLTSLKSWNLGRTADKEIKFPKHKNERPDQTVRPTILCLYSFSSIESADISRSRKKWKIPKIEQVMKKQSKSASRLHARACMRGQNPNSQAVSVGPWQHFSYWQLVSSLKTEPGRAWNMNCVLDSSDRFVCLFKSIHFPIKI